MTGSLDQTSAAASRLSPDPGKFWLRIEVASRGPSPAHGGGDCRLAALTSAAMVEATSGDVELQLHRYYAGSRSTVQAIRLRLRTGSPSRRISSPAPATRKPPAAAGTGTLRSCRRHPPRPSRALPALSVAAPRQFCHQLRIHVVALKTSQSGAWSPQHEQCDFHRPCRVESSTGVTSGKPCTRSMQPLSATLLGR